MLSRVAENIYWMARYIERAENAARLVNVNTNLLLDLPGVERPRPSAEPARATTPAILTEAERRERDRATIEQALAAAGGKVFGPGGAAEILGVKPTTLASRIKRLGIERNKAR